MRIAVIGATGRLGSAIAREAAARGHRVTQLNRSTVDATDPASIANVVAGHDAVVAAVKGPDRVVPRAALALIQALPDAGVARLVFVGGGGSLEQAPGRRFIDAPDFPVEYLQTARDQAEALDILRRSASTLAWSYASPPPLHLIAGDKRGGYLAEARDTPITDGNGESRITIGDYADAVVDTIEHDTFHRQRFTAAYAKRRMIA